MKNSGFVLLISGPSGAGKSTLLKLLLEEFKEELYFSVSSTTRKAREGEIDGVHYHFVSEDEFKQGIERGEFLEYAKVHNNYYGTSLLHTQKALENGKCVIYDIDVQGFHIAKDKLRNLISSVFITTKNKKELENRLSSRGSNDDLAKRLENASLEMKELDKYDYVIINEDIKEAYLGLKSIFLAQRLSIKRYNTEQILHTWIKENQ